MTGRNGIRVVWSLWTVAVLVGATVPVLAIVNRMPPGDWLVAGIAMVLGLGNATVGRMIATRHPGNPIGWLFVVVGLGLMGAIAGSLYAVRGLISAPGSLPGVTPVSWISNWLWFVGLAPVPLIFLLFPTGRVPTSRWRILMGAVIGGAAVGMIGAIFKPGQLAFTYDNSTVRLSNPTGIEGLGDLFEGLLVAGNVTLVGGALLAVVALIFRYRRAGGDERQQIKWLALVGATAAMLFVTMMVVGTVLEQGGNENSFVEDLLFVLFFGSLGVGIPAASAVAILKYRLYDIDRIINKTLVYGVLTAVLVGVYVGAVLGIGTVVRAISGQETNSVVVAISTLAVAALFRPARSRIQALIDRRFYRRKYDAARTLETFTARLRDEIDLESLRGHVVGVVRETVQPAHVSLWLAGREAVR